MRELFLLKTIMCYIVKITDMHIELLARNSLLNLLRI